MENKLFQALHSPIGANATFALGLKHGGGGFGLEQERVPEQDIYIGYKEGDDVYALPFFKSECSNFQECFVQESVYITSGGMRVFTENQIKREFAYATDSISERG